VVAPGAADVGRLLDQHEIVPPGLLQPDRHADAAKPGADDRDVAHLRHRGTMLVGRLSVCIVVIGHRLVGIGTHSLASPGAGEPPWGRTHSISAKTPHESSPTGTN